MREGADNSFTDSSAACISMEKELKNKSSSGSSFALDTDLSVPRPYSHESVVVVSIVIVVGRRRSINGVTPATTWSSFGLVFMVVSGFTQRGGLLKVVLPERSRRIEMIVVDWDIVVRVRRRFLGILRLGMTVVSFVHDLRDMSLQVPFDFLLRGTIGRDIGVLILIWFSGFLMCSSLVVDFSLVLPVNKTKIESEHFRHIQMNQRHENQQEEMNIPSWKKEALFVVETRNQSTWSLQESFQLLEMEQSATKNYNQPNISHKQKNQHLVIQKKSKLTLELKGKKGESKN
ncbi:hypothetical protein Ccrd_010385 [Cynara cardunculus var. scolymus]|uniref:Transmembrane protein n=1 Tax=Cynara cardunculus var. scolymus TaxID=59895 RepID=A0A118K6U4_CYNCS|nr:hypothetical protein Ccrd_010385 [Cynara cardunculus var. scolymus]